MKIIALITLFALPLMSSSDSTTITTSHQSTVVDEDFLKKELQQSVLEFCDDMGIDPDTVYLPFRDSI
jgi:hypothetical protein